MPFVGYPTWQGGSLVTGGQQMGTFDHVLSMVDGRDYGLWDHGRMIGGEKEIVIS